MTAAGFMLGAKQLAQLISTAPKYFKDCKETQADFTRFEHWATIFEHPWELTSRIVRNVPFNIKDIVRTTAESITEYKIQEFYKFGMDLGELLVLIVGEAETKGWW